MFKILIALKVFEIDSDHIFIYVLEQSLDSKESYTDYTG